MHRLSPLEWRQHIHLTSDLETPGDRAEFYKRVRSGEYVALFRGAYIRANLLAAADRHEQYRWRVLAGAALSDGELVLSHESAAVMWRLPALGSWPARVHSLEPVAAGGRSTHAILRHTVGLPDEVISIDGLRVTTLARTVVDLARGRPFEQAVTFADAALRRTNHPVPGVPRSTLTRADLWEELAAAPMRHGTAKGRKAIDFSSELADRPGESISRVNMSIGGITPPELQVRMRGASGAEYIVDFWWKGFNKIGEFDGASKYSDPEFLRGRTPEQALLDEKFREDDLRATGRGMTRWPWKVAISPRLLRAHLLAAGIR